MTDRRQVLGGIGAGLAVLGLPRRAGAAGAKPFGYAVVGLGYYAIQQIMPAFARCDHARLVALVSGTPAKLERYGAEYNIPATHRYSYGNFDRIRDNPDIDAVYVILPNSMHAEYTIRAAAAGKDVMCEKPMAVSVAECRAMIAACRRAGTKLMIGYRSRFEPYNRLAIELARGGHVGPTRLITAEHGFDAKPGQWRLDRGMSGGGSLMDIGIYSVNAARYLTGEEPVEVSAVEATDRSDPRFRSVEDRISFLLRFPSGIEANCVSSYSSAHNALRVVGPDGWIDMEPATSYGGHAMRIRKDGVVTPRVLPKPRRDQFAAQLDHLAESVAVGTAPLTAGEEGLADMRVMEAIYRSASERRHVSLRT